MQARSPVTPHTSTGVAAAARQAEQVQQARKHVCCINGSSVFLDAARALLESEHYNVTTTNVMPLTYYLISMLQPDLLLLDVVYGVRAEWELLERLAEEAATTGLPIIITASDPALLRRAQVLADALAEPHAVTRYLELPVDPGALRALAQEMIGLA
jgi:CheY-like chemotaxis protein